MKFLPGIFLLLFISGLHAQQTKFLEIPSNNKSFAAPVFPSRLAEIFETAEEQTSITIYPEYLTEASKYDFSRLKNLELVEIKFAYNPDSSDAGRNFFIDSINVLMKNLVAFQKCPKLKRIVFCIGEQIYLTHKQTDVANAYDDDVRQKLFDDNKKGAWEAFGKDVNKLLPGVKLYAFTWGW